MPATALSSHAASTSPTPSAPRAGVLPATVGACLASALVGGALVGWLVAGPGTTEPEYRAAALVAVVTAAGCFGTAIVVAWLTRRLAPSLWGYVPGLLLVVVAGLSAAESSRAPADDRSVWIAAAVLLNPFFWAPVLVATRMFRAGSVGPVT